MQQDFFGNDLWVGDEVAFMEVGYRTLKLGKIKKITGRMVFVGKNDKDLASDWTKQMPSQVIKKFVDGNPCANGNHDWIPCGNQICASDFHNVHCANCDKHGFINQNPRKEYEKSY